MKLYPLPEVPGETANVLPVQCYAPGCQRRLAYGEAVRAGGWTYDREGPAFRAYYCPQCTIARGGTRVPQHTRVCRCGHPERDHYDGAGRCRGREGRCGCVLFEPVTQEQTT